MAVVFNGSSTTIATSVPACRPRATSSGERATPRSWFMDTSSSGPRALRAARRGCSPSPSRPEAAATPVLARDGFGIKPLYLRRTARQISFASEVRALALDGGGATSIDPAFAHTFLRIGYVPSPKTAFSGIAKMEPGTLCGDRPPTGDMRTETFYRLTPARWTNKTPMRSSSDLRELLNLPFAVTSWPTFLPGSFCPGGSTRARSPCSRTTTSRRPRRFRSGFRRRTVATRRRLQLPSPQSRQRKRPDRPWPREPGGSRPIVDALEEPLADSAVLPLWYLCRGTAQHVKVALSGEGGDEVLGGYSRYFWGPVVDDLASPVAATRGRGARPDGTFSPRARSGYSIWRAAPQSGCFRLLEALPDTSPGSTSSRPTNAGRSSAKVMTPRRRATNRYSPPRTTWVWIPSSGCSTSTSERCCSTTCS